VSGGAWFDSVILGRAGGRRRMWAPADLVRHENLQAHGLIDTVNGGNETAHVADDARPPLYLHSFVEPDGEEPERIDAIRNAQQPAITRPIAAPRNFIRVDPAASNPTQARVTTSRSGAWDTVTEPVRGKQHDHGLHPSRTALLCSTHDPLNHTRSYDVLTRLADPHQHPTRLGRVQVGGWGGGGG